MTDSAHGFDPPSFVVKTNELPVDVAAIHESEHLIYPKYRPDIDGLRAIAVLSVVLYHAFPFLCPGGIIGVDIFFVISGFLISAIIFENLERGTFSFLEFYSRRIRRIFPTLLLVLAGSYAFGWIALFADEYRQLSKHIAAGAGFVSNFVLWDESGYFDNSAATKPLLHLWSLGVEEQFYIIWPLTLWIAWRGRMNFLGITILVGAISFYLNVSEVNSNPVAAFFSPQTRFWELMTGAVLAHLTLHRHRTYETISQELSAKVDQYKICNILSLLGALFIIAGLIAISGTSSFPGWWAVIPTAGSVIIISAGQDAWFNRAVLSNRALVWFGLISYPLYMWHWPLLTFARIVQGGLPSPGTPVILVGISIVLAWLTYKFIELPIRRGAYSSAKTLSLFALMLMVGCIGYSTFKFDGLPTRPLIKHAENVSAEFQGPYWKFYQNNTCLHRYPFWERFSYPYWFCMASKDEKPTLLLLGNSYANELYAGLSRNDGFSHHSILSIGDCDPEDQELDDSEITPHPCSGYRKFHQQEFINNIIATSESLRFVIMDGLVSTPDAQYIAGIKRRIDFVEQHNAIVILFIPHLELTYDIRNCFSRPFGNSIRSCEVDIQERIKLNDTFGALVKQLAQTNPEVLIFDQNDLFCDSRKCSMIRDGMPLLRDEYQHMSEYGSIELAKMFQKWSTTHAPDILR